MDIMVETKGHRQTPTSINRHHRVLSGLQWSAFVAIGPACFCRLNMFKLCFLGSAMSEKGPLAIVHVGLLLVGL